MPLTGWAFNHSSYICTASAFALPLGCWDVPAVVLTSQLCWTRYGGWGKVVFLLCEPLLLILISTTDLSTPGRRPLTSSCLFIVCSQTQHSFRRHVTMMKITRFQSATAWCSRTQRPLTQSITTQQKGACNNTAAESCRTLHVAEPTTQHNLHRT